MGGVQLPQNLDADLRVKQVIPVTVHASYPLPAGDTNYDPMRQVVAAGFEVEFLRFLHAAGCKCSKLPSGNVDRCLNAAGLLYESIDWSKSPPRWRTWFEDGQGSLSWMLGVGFCTLLAHDTYAIPWDQLEPIVGRGTRFDYRGRASGRSCVFEARGTRHKGNQRPQVVGAHNKKTASGVYGDWPTADVSLAVSSWMGGDERPGVDVLVGDPPTDGGWPAFGPDEIRLYRLRHYARVTNLMGLGKLARTLYQAALVIGRGGEPRPRSLPMRAELAEISVGPQLFMGRWLPPTHRENQDGFEPAEFFIGLHSAVLTQLLAGDITVGKRPVARQIEMPGLRDEEGQAISIMPDGSLMTGRAVGSNGPRRQVSSNGPSKVGNIHRTEGQA